MSYPPEGRTIYAGRLRRIGIVHAALAMLALGILAKAAHVQLVQGRAWSALARRQHFTAKEVPAPRGRILDAGGRTLATSRELVRLDVAPRELRDGQLLRRELARAGVPHEWALRAADTQRSWVVLPGRFVAEDVAGLTATRGVYTTPVSDRAYAMSPGLQPLLGRVDTDGRALDGLELTLDSLLRGTSGASRLVRDVRGRSFVSPTVPGASATPGLTVKLTINQELQEIAERALAAAVSRMGAEGGDIVILDPRSGEVLAMAGERKGVLAPSVTALTEPFEPGSTLKPLIAAGLLARGKARVEDVVPARGGTYELHGRTIHDEPNSRRTLSMLSLADVIRFSSNVGIVQFAERLTEREEYETLRDFGLGTQTGLPYSSEASGTLRPPHMWSKQSAASHALGYEVAVTPMQLALAYAAIANGGELLEPVIVKEVRSPDGKLRFRQSRRVVRRVMPEHVALTLRRLLAEVVERGTAVDADLTSYALAGKTGTPRRTVRGRYAPMQYNPNFVGLFPVDNPQLVVVVKLTSPKGDYHGGRTAAPVTKTILQAALAARDAAIDRKELVGARRATEPIVQAGGGRTSVATARVAESYVVATDTMARPVTFDLPSEPFAPPERERASLPPRPVPDVRGLTLRDAVRSLHSAGFRVQLTHGPSSMTLTEPASGVKAAAGSVVRLRYRR